MRSKFIWLVILAGVLLSARPVYSQTLTLIRGLNFGEFAPTSGGGTITITPGGAISHDGPMDLGGTQQAGIIEASGTPDTAFSVTYGGSSIPLVSGGDSLTLTNFSDNAPPTFDITGIAEFNVGATLVVASAQPYGTYQGDLTVSIAYE